jgi:hypothetical protein
LEHNVLVQGAVGGPVPGPALPMNAMAAPGDVSAALASSKICCSVSWSC